MKTKRLVFRVRWEKKGRWWKLVGPVGNVVMYREKKVDIVKAGRATCRDQWIGLGHLAQLVIHNKDGKIQRGNGEATYGKDPKRSKG